jgi:hypothetical protein
MKQLVRANVRSPENGSEARTIWPALSTGQHDRKWARAGMKPPRAMLDG